VISRPDIPIPGEVTIELNTKIIGKDAYYFKSISSTNLFTKKLAEDGIGEGVVVVADVQTSGRGRKNRTWLSPYGGLWFSVILRPNIPPERGMLVTMTASVAVAQAIKEITGVDPVIKWPNDLLINGKKVCGILTEFDAEMDKINYTVVGIGINVNNEINDEIKKIATSMLIETGSKIQRVKLLRTILKYFDENYVKLVSGEYSFIRNLWSSYANIIGRKIEVENEGNIVSGVVSDIDDSGYLILKTKNDTVRIVSGNVIY